VQSLPSNLKESWESAKKRCEYAYSQDAATLLESKLVEIEKIAKEPVAALNKAGFRPTTTTNTASRASPSRTPTSSSSLVTTTPSRTNTNSNNNSVGAISQSKPGGAGLAKPAFSSTPTKLQSSPAPSNTAQPTVRSPNPDKVIVTKTVGGSSAGSTVSNSPKSPTANHATPPSQSAPSMDANDRHRPSTRGKGRARANGQQEDISHLLDSLSNL
jgi:hypothetical protein